MSHLVPDGHGDWNQVGGYQYPWFISEQQEGAEAAIAGVEFLFLSKDTMTQMSERIPGATQMGARCLGLTVKGFHDYIENKIIALPYFIPLFKSAMAQELPKDLQEEALEAFWIAVHNSLAKFMPQPKAFFDAA